MGLVAGGVGIAPMLSILRQNRLARDPGEIQVIYGNRWQDQIVCRNELTDAGSVFVLSQPPQDWHGESGWADGPLRDRVLLPDQFENRLFVLFVLCGPAAMMDVVEDHLAARRTPSRRILPERFDYDRPVQTCTVVQKGCADVLDREHYPVLHPAGLCFAMAGRSFCISSVIPKPTWRIRSD